MADGRTKISLFLLLVFGIVWLGAVNVRAIIGNELLNFGTIEFKSTIDPELEREVFRLISLSSIVIAAGYAGTFLGALVFVRTTPLRFKENGWLMMSSILFFIFSPIEFYTLFLDLKMVSLDLLWNASPAEFRALFMHRLTTLAGVNIIALLSYYTIIGLAIWQPMKRA